MNIFVSPGGALSIRLRPKLYIFKQRTKIILLYKRLFICSDLRKKARIPIGFMPEATKIFRISRYENDVSRSFFPAAVQEASKISKNKSGLIFRIEDTIKKIENKFLKTIDSLTLLVLSSSLTGGQFWL